MKAQQLLESADEKQWVLVMTSQVLREYLVVATRPVKVNGLGLSALAAAQNITAFLSRVALLAESLETSKRLLTLVEEGRAAGKQIHDANLIAAALTLGVRRVVTDNAAHFKRFDDLLTVAPL